MMSSAVKFESQTEKEERKKQLRRERNAVLSKAEAEYDRKEKRKKTAALQGEGSWMLPSVEDRINREKDLDEGLCSSKKKKKEKKEKKKKHHKHKIYQEKDSQFSSSTDSDESHQWVEKSLPVAANVSKPVQGPKLERESWMTIEMPFAASHFSNSPSVKEAGCPKNELFDKPGQHHLELNPYWKDGGSGLPEKMPLAAESLAGVTDDAGWLRKSLQRCIEMAKEENRTVDEVAAERYGSLENLHNRLAAAEAKAKSGSAKFGSRRFHRPDERDEDKGQPYSLQPHNRNVTHNWRKKQVQSHSNVKCRDQDPSNSCKKTEEPDDEENGSSSDDSMTPEDKNSSSLPEDPIQLLSEEEINKLGAQIVKAELLGDEALAEKLKRQLQTAQNCKTAAKIAASAAIGTADESKIGNKLDDEIVLLTRTNRFGMTRPIANSQSSSSQLHGYQRKRKFERTHEKSGKRENYFPDDNKYSLKDLVEREKLSTSEDANLLFARLAGRNVQGDDEDLDDKMIDKAAMKQSASLMESKERQLAIIEHKKMSASLAKCKYCFENVPKHLIVAVGLKVYLSLPRQRSMVEGHCFIIPIQHETQGTKCDEDVWDEIKIFQKGLTEMFKDAGKDCMFLETSLNLKRFPHMYVECIPVPKETGEMSPLYFKKALQECESEWAQNRKILDLSKKDIRQSIPKGFPYFSVVFGITGGYAHVIEDEKRFSSYFGKEVIGGMLELGETQWRSSHDEAFEEQRKKVVKFADKWKHYDWTKQLKLV